MDFALKTSMDMF